MVKGKLRLNARLVEPVSDGTTLNFKLDDEFYRGEIKVIGEEMIIQDEGGMVTVSFFNYDTEARITTQKVTEVYEGRQKVGTLKIM